MALVEPLVDYLRQLERQGESHVHLDEEARLILREFYIRARGGAGARVAAVAKPVVDEVKFVAAEAEQVTDDVSDVVVEPEVVVVTELVVEGVTAAEKIAGLKAQAGSWGAVRALESLREKLVFSGGHPEADIMFVGEAPGYHEELKGEVFVGPAGKKLDGILKAMGMGRAEVYLTNLVKFRPAQANQTTNTRKPTVEEMASCMAFLKAEIAVVQPKVVIALGATVAEGLLGLSGKVEDMRERFHDVDGVPVRVTFHPSYLLHAEATDGKRMVWEDMLAVMDYLGMAISEKQRGYFQKG